MGQVLTCMCSPACWLGKGSDRPNATRFHHRRSHLVLCSQAMLCTPGCRSMQEPRANHAILEAHLRGLEGRIEECISTKADRSVVPLRAEVSLQAYKPSVCRAS